MGIYHFREEDARRFALERGIKTRQRGDELHFEKCPYCRERTDQKNSFAINLKTGQYRCLRATCNAKGNMLSLAHDFGFSLGSDVDEYYEQRRKYRDITNYPRPITKGPAVTYLESRGISKATTEKYSITTQKSNDNILVFPFYDENGKLQFVKYRRMDFDKKWCETDCKPILFGMDQCNLENKTLVLTEGQIDSLSVTEAGIENAVSVPTGANGFTWVPYCWNFLSKFETLIVFGDHEKGKITLLEEMRGRFSGTIKHVRPENYLGCKDANDILRKYGKEAVRAAVQNAVILESQRIVRLADVKRVNLSEMEKFETGIQLLDRTLGGGLFLGQLIILTGERGEGKSTLASQIATMALDSGYDVFFYSGELTDYYFKSWFDFQVAGPDYINCIVNRFGDKTYSVRADAQADMENWYREHMYLYDNDILNGTNETESLPETIQKAICLYFQ